MDLTTKNSGATKKNHQNASEQKKVDDSSSSPFALKRTFKGDMRNSDSLEKERSNKFKENRRSSFLRHHTEKGDPVYQENIEKTLREIDFDQPFTIESETKQVKIFYDEARSEDELLELPSKEIWGRTSHTNVNNLFSLSPKPQPPLTERHLKKIQQNQDPSSVMIEKVNKLKNGMKRLQEITQKFNCTDRYKTDVDYIVKNIGRALNESEKLRNKKESHTSTDES